MAPESIVQMSKKLEKRAIRLRRKAENRALIIRRVVREFRDGNLTVGALDPTWQTEKHREIELAVGRYNEVHKALRRINKKA